MNKYRVKRYGLSFTPKYVSASSPQEAVEIAGIGRPPYRQVPLDYKDRYMFVDYWNRRITVVLQDG